MLGSACCTHQSKVFAPGCRAGYRMEAAALVVLAVALAALAGSEASNRCCGIFSVRSCIGTRRSHWLARCKSPRRAWDLRAALGLRSKTAHRPSGPSLAPPQSAARTARAVRPGQAKVAAVEGAQAVKAAERVQAMLVEAGGMDRARAAAQLAARNFHMHRKWQRIGAQPKGASSGREPP